MCGIAGVMMASGAAPESRILDALEGALRCRGPDGVGRYCHENVGLVHTRLAIIDLTSGMQPLVGRNSVLVANGEIYNYIELRNEVLANVSFATASDCETVLHLYDREGANCTQRLRGMYAFAIYDPNQKCLMLSRDPFGIKPCYYIETPTCFAFASEPQALVSAGLIDPDLAPHPTIELLQLQFTTGPETIFRGIRRLLPGETLIVKAGRIVERRTRAALPPCPPLKIGEAEALKQLDTVLTDSVKVHQRSDVPYGLFLSSGIDSSAILACMARLNGIPVEAYTASFPNTGIADEYPEAHRLAISLGARHIKVEITADDFWSLLPEIVACLDDPTADYAIVPTYILAREAAKNLKVILCGEGGDEIFAGYSRYRRQIRPRWLGGRVRRRSGPFSAGGVVKDLPSDWRSGIVAAEQAASLSKWTPLQRAQAADCVDFLPHGLLTKLDRCLMAHGVEGRTPLLDPMVAELGFRLPRKLQLGRRGGKYLLRRWLNEHAPQASPFARKKGFTVPVGVWIAAAGERLAPLVANYPGVSAICNPEAVRSLFVSGDTRHLEAAWRLLFFALWHRRHICGLQPHGDAFECLSSL